MCLIIVLLNFNSIIKYNLRPCRFYVIPLSYVYYPTEIIQIRFSVNIIPADTQTMNIDKTSAGLMLTHSTLHTGCSIIKLHNI